MLSHGSDEEEEKQKNDEMETEEKKESEEPKKEELTEEEKQWREEARQRTDYQEMIQDGLDELVVFHLLKMFETGWITYEEMDDKLKTGLSALTPRQGVQFLKVMGKRDLTYVASKCAYLLGQMRVFNFYIRRKESIFNGPDPKKMEELLQMTGYTVEESTGQRVYGGPPPGWEGPRPAHREILISKIPHDWYEDKLVPLLSQYGKIYELRIMIDNITGWTRNFCFVHYCSEDDNSRALRKIDGYNYEEKKTLKANFSSGNKRLFVGNIPKTTSKEELDSVFSTHVPEITSVEVCVSDEMTQKDWKNRGFCFVEFTDHRAAALGKKIFAGLGPKIYNGDKLKVEWFEQQQPCSDKELSKCKTIHVGNISTEVKEDLLTNTFERYGKVALVQKVRDYAFIHMEDRESAIKAIEALNGTELAGFSIKCAISQSGPLKRKMKKKAEARRLRGEKKQRPAASQQKKKSSFGEQRDGGIGGHGRDRSAGDRMGGRFGGDRRSGSYGGDRHSGSYGGDRRSGSYGDDRRSGSYGRDRQGGGYDMNRQGGGYGMVRQGGGYGGDRQGGGGKYKYDYGFGGHGGYYGYGGSGGGEGHGGKRKRDEGYGGGYSKYQRR